MMDIELTSAGKVLDGLWVLQPHQAVGVLSRLMSRMHVWNRSSIAWLQRVSRPAAPAEELCVRTMRPMHGLSKACCSRE
jgi:hypothetical protein